MPQKPSELKSFVLWEHQVYYEKEKREFPSQLILYGADTFDTAQFDEAVRAQFWSCPEKEAFIARCRYSIMASNMLAAGLPVLEQYGILADYADAVLELFPDCIGIIGRTARTCCRERFTSIPPGILRSFIFWTAA